MHPGRPCRLRAGCPRPGHQQQVTGSPGCLRSRPLPGFGCGKALKPVCQDADHVGESCHAVLEDLHALLEGGHRPFLVSLANLLNRRSPSVTRLFQMGTTGPGGAGPNGLSLPPKLTAGDAKPLPAYGGVAACGPPGRPRGGWAVLVALGGHDDV